MSALALPPLRHRPETKREVELRLELDVLRRDVREACDDIEPRLDRLVPVAVEIGPPALQLVAGAARKVQQLRLRVSE